MTNFEVIILLMCYLFGIGYTVKYMGIDECESFWAPFLITAVALIVAVYFPVMLAYDLYDKLE